MTDRIEVTLVADCQSCFGLCCVAPSLTASSDFAITKSPGTPCSNLDTDDRCSIHDKLRPSGFRGCTVFDCFGAGQKLSQQTFGGRSWRTDPERAGQMFAAFMVMRDLHESLWYVTDALAHLDTPELREALADLEDLSHEPADRLERIDSLAVASFVDGLLVRASETIRAGDGGPGRSLAGADLGGARLRGADLRGADLRGASLAGADLSGADLRDADVMRADFRDTELAGADLDGALYLVQAQLNTATGDSTTRLSARLRRPTHWV